MKVEPPRVRRRPFGLVMPPWQAVPTWRGRRDVADGLQEPPVVEPVHPFQRRELDGF